ncbi:MAG: response regulator transcription factor [Cyanobacteriota bacterium]
MKINLIILDKNKNFFNRLNDYFFELNNDKEFYKFELLFFNNKSQFLDNYIKNTFLIIDFDLYLKGYEKISFSPYKDNPIIIMSNSNLLEDKIKSFKMGSDDYLLRSVDEIEVYFRIIAILKRYCNIKNNSDENIVINNNKSSVKIENRENIYLTDSELKILNYLFLNRNKLISTDELLEQALGYPSGLGNPEIIRTHIKTLRAKIDLDKNKASIIVNVHKRGYIYESF